MVLLNQETGERKGQNNPLVTLNFFFPVGYFFSSLVYNLGWRPFVSTVRGFLFSVSLSHFQKTSLRPLLLLVYKKHFLLLFRKDGTHLFLIQIPTLLATLLPSHNPHGYLHVELPILNLGQVDSLEADGQEKEVPVGSQRFYCFVTLSSLKTGNRDNKRKN